MIVIPSVILPVTLATLAAYAFSWMRFKGRDWLFVVVFALQIVPLQMALIPLLRIFSSDTFEPILEYVPYLSCGSRTRVRPATGDLPAAQLHLGGARAS